MGGIKYVSPIPASVPAGKVLVHDQVKWWQDARPCRSGFRASFGEPGLYYEECHSGRAWHLNKHYVGKRVRRPTLAPLQQGLSLSTAPQRPPRCRGAFSFG